LPARLGASLLSNLDSLCGIVKNPDGREGIIGGQFLRRVAGAPGIGIGLAGNLTDP
jgi:hypothetical protein